MSVNGADRRLMRIRGRARAASERPIPAKVQAYLSGASMIAVEPEPKEPSTCPEGTERRQSERVTLDSSVIVRRVGGFNFEVALQDLSTGGCRVRMLEPAEVGDPVIARLPQLEPLGSRVSWAEGTTTGMQFLAKIHPAVFDALLTRLPRAE
ncbi:MAG TPA: PilZ domain-containing protein [Sphingomicrobium sp.]|jgi:hypothetical protein